MAGGRGGGVGDWLESHVETHSNFVFFFFFFFFACVVVLYGLRGEVNF